ncbi:MAG TPA: D-aminoacylase [Candidatus Acidoferrales bacterium]|nr:D-aminoacylase [Candidatus Acidoferrales bacterium]
MRRRIVVVTVMFAVSGLAFAFAARETRPALAQGGAQDREFDVVIRNGHIIDGTGSPWYAGDVGIRDGHIAAIGNLSRAQAKQVIDAAGRVVAPGFIDMLGQSEITMLVDPHVPSKIFQGITTEITGEGDSVAPQTDATLKDFHEEFAHYGITPDWRTFAQYFARLQKQGMGINLGTYVGATQLRRYVIGDADQKATPGQLEKMKALVAEAMREGAMGLSTALQYPPAPYASTEELIALASVASQYGGIYATHMRNEGDGEMAALAETARIAREAHIPVEIFHLKTAGKPNWGKMPQVVAFIDKQRSEGLDIEADTYAYTAWNNDLAAFMPPWAHDGGDAKLIARLKDPAMRARIRKEMETRSTSWDNEWQEIAGPEGVLISSVQNPDLLSLQGKTLADIAKMWHEDAIDALCDLLIKDNAFTNVSVFGMTEPDVELALKQPWVSIDNDYGGMSPTGLLGKEHAHPRAYGTFPRILRKFVREKHLLTLPEAIRKFSALPAQREHLRDRGVLKKGMWADVVVFDPAKVHDVGTYEKPNQLAVGMDYVLVNGVPVIADGKMTNALPGKVLYGPGYAGHAQER